MGTAAALSGILGCLALLPAAVPAAAQQPAGVRWFPDTTAFAPLLAAPRETGLRGAFVAADRPDLENLPPMRPGEGGLRGDFEGRNVEAEVALGLRLPVALFQPEGPGRPSIALEFETGIFSRFFMESAQKDLINVDFRVGAPLSLGYRGWEGRLELRHMSSHLGDDFTARFGADLTRQFSEEGFELLVARRLAERAVRLYAGGEVNFGISASDDVERKAARWGIEYYPDEAGAGRGAGPGSVEGPRRGAGRRSAGRWDVWPFAALDFRADDLTDEVAGTMVAGVAFRVGEVGLRLEARGHFGPTPMGRLREADETFWGLGIRIQPTGAYR